MYIFFYVLSLIFGVSFVLLAIVNFIAASLYGPLSYFLEGLLIFLAILSFSFAGPIKRKRIGFIIAYIIILAVSVVSYLIEVR